MKRMSALHAVERRCRTSSAGAAALGSRLSACLARSSSCDLDGRRRGARVLRRVSFRAGHTEPAGAWVRTIVAVRSAQREQALSEGGVAAASVVVEAAQTVEERRRWRRQERRRWRAARAAAASPNGGGGVGAMGDSAAGVGGGTGIGICGAKIRDDAAPRRAAPSPSKTTKRR